MRKSKGESSAPVTASGRSIRGHLFQVLLVSIVPIGLVAAGLLFLHWQAQEHERERSQVESARILATAVDNALDSTIQRLSIFARVWAASPAAEGTIYAQAREALAGNPDWSNILAFRADGTGVFRTDVPFGTAVPDMSLPHLWRPVLQDKGAYVSDVFASPLRGVKVASIGVPVMRGNEVTHVLIATLNMKWFDDLLTRQGIAHGGVAGIFDRNWKFAARSIDGEARRGSDPAAPLVADMKRNPEGIGRYASLDNVGVFTSWTPTRHGWWVAYATPARPIDSAFWGHLILFGCLWAGALIAGVAYAWSKGRLVAQSLVSLERQAEHLAEGRRLGGLPASRVKEVDQALAALEQASEVLQRAMRERNESLETEREARAVAEAANRAKDEFLAMLGHELRNPLAAISNAATILKSGDRSAGQVDFASGIIARQCQHLKRLIDDLLDVGRVMTGKILLERQPLELAASVRHVAATLETAGRLAERRVDIEARPVWIDGDPTRVEQVVTNLMVNAATYTSPHGRIRVEVAPEGGSALLRVSDDGRGIAPEDLERVFELFFQADTTVERAQGGLGIGLTLVRRLVELHGGKVSAHSEGKGKGASFAVRLPAIAAPEQPQRLPGAARRATPQTILVVEDNTDERESLCVALRLLGHRVLSAADGTAALAQMRQHRPPVAVLDIGLPGMDGYRLAEAIRAEFGREVVLIALTGYGTSSDERRAKRAGFDRHFTKPVAVSELNSALEPAARGSEVALSPYRSA